MEKIKACQIKIFGRVQNVGFRFHTQDEALRLGIKGFVMNQPDGSVYVEAEDWKKTWTSLFFGAIKVPTGHV